MKFRVSTIVNIMLSMVLMVSIVANLTGAVDYNPWLDVTDDGYGGIDDIVSTAEHFGASGDPTKLCNITGRANKLIQVAYLDSLIPGIPWQSGYIPVDGYAKVTILIETHSANLKYILYAYDNLHLVSWKVEEITGFPGTLVKTYDVMNQEISIEIQSYESYIDTVNVDVYLVP